MRPPTMADDDNIPPSVLRLLVAEENAEKKA